MTADAKPNVTAFVLLDHIRDDEELEAYVQARAAYEITLAVARERERCALLLEKGVDLKELHSMPEWQHYTANLLTICASAIRTTKAPT